MQLLSEQGAGFKPATWYTHKCEPYSVVKANPTKGMIEEAAGIAKAKSRHMWGDRSPPEKYKDSFLGTLAEGAMEALMYYWGIPDVKRYDDARTDGFEKPDEYDLMVGELTVDCKSSGITHLGSFHTYDVIGPAVNGKHSDIYVQSLYHYRSPGKNVEDMLKNGEVDLYLVCGITHSDMVKKGRVRQVYGNGKERRVVRILDAIPIPLFLQELEKVVGKDNSSP
jgi:hypothetical protein